jgi:hypothetical protein
LKENFLFQEKMAIEVEKKVILENGQGKQWKWFLVTHAALAHTRSCLQVISLPLVFFQLVFLGEQAFWPAGFVSLFFENTHQQKKALQSHP